MHDDGAILGGRGGSRRENAATMMVAHRCNGVRADSKRKRMGKVIKLNGVEQYQNPVSQSQ